MEGSGGFQGLCDLKLVQVGALDPLSLVYGISNAFCVAVSRGPVTE